MTIPVKNPLKQVPLWLALGLDPPADWWDPWDVKTRKRQRRKPRKPSLAAAIRQARKAGLTAGTVTVDGVTLTFGTAEPTQTNGNEWDEELIRGKH